MAPSPRAEVPQRRYSSPRYSLQSLSPIFHQKSGLVPEPKSRFVPQESKRSGDKPEFVFSPPSRFPRLRVTAQISLGVLLIQMERGTSGEWDACEPQEALFSRFFATAGSMFGPAAYPLSGQDPESPTRGQQMISNLVLTPLKTSFCFASRELRFSQEIKICSRWEEWDLAFISPHILVSTAYHWSVASVGWWSPGPGKGGDRASLYAQLSRSGFIPRERKALCTAFGRSQIHLLFQCPLFLKSLHTTPIIKLLDANQLTISFYLGGYRRYLGGTFSLLIIGLDVVL